MGDDTVGAEIVAAVHNADPALKAVLSAHRQSLYDITGFRGHELPLSIGQCFIQHLRQLPLGMGGENACHMGIAFFHPLYHLGLPRHTAGEENQLVGMPPPGMS